MIHSFSASLLVLFLEYTFRDGNITISNEIPCIPEIDIIAAHKFAGGGPLMCIPKVDNRVIRKLIMHKKL